MTSTAPAPTVGPTTALPTPTTPANTLGIVSLVLGITGIVTGLNPLLGIPAVVLGIMALRREPGSRGFAIAGIVTGAVTFVWVAIGVVATLFLLPLAGVFAVLD
jgi:hypothetical protein